MHSNWHITNTKIFGWVLKVVNGVLLRFVKVKGRGQRPGWKKKKKNPNREGQRHKALDVMTREDEKEKKIWDEGGWQRGVRAYVSLGWVETWVRWGRESQSEVESEAGSLRWGRREREIVRVFVRVFRSFRS